MLKADRPPGCSAMQVNGDLLLDGNFIEVKIRCGLQAIRVLRSIDPYPRAKTSELTILAKIGDSVNMRGRKTYVTLSVDKSGEYEILLVAGRQASTPLIYPEGHLSIIQNHQTLVKAGTCLFVIPRTISLAINM